MTSPEPSSWTYTVSVRSLCEFTAKRGDLDRRFTPSATSLEGQAGQMAVIARRSPGYETELPLQGQHGHLRVRGRADGFEADVNRLEEIKTIRGPVEIIPENRRALHWAQLETYGALIAADRGLAELELALVYVDADTQHETVLRETVAAPALQAAFEARCRAFEAWAAQEAGHRAARDEALAQLPFPLGELRPGQRLLAEAVYRATAHGRCLLAQAPTGIGKTLGTLYPLLRAMPSRQLDKIGYMTCKGTGRIMALDALQALREATPGRHLRVLTLVAKEQACEHPTLACHGDACPLARGFYDRLPAAREEAVRTAWLDPSAQRRIALQHGICPYYLGQELLRWADVVVGDVHHAFDPHGQLFNLAQAQDWRLALLVDEAHNLVDRARAMYSATLSLQSVRDTLPQAPKPMRPALRRLARELATLAGAQPAAYQAFAEVPEALADALQLVNAALGEHMQNHPLENGPLMQFYFETLSLQRVLDKFGEHSLCDLERGPATARAAAPAEPRAALPVNLSLLDDDPDHAEDTGPALPDGTDVLLSIRNIVPGAFLRQRFEGLHSATLFSATLGPADYQRDLLGLPEDTAWIDVPAPFPPEHLSVRVADRLSTRYEHREASLDALVAVLARQFEEHPGNYLAFFSSFDYLDKAAARLARRHPSVPQWSQSRAMGEAARRAFLDRFVPDGRGIGFAVLGGAFAEGVDLPGTRLIGAFIATLGLPPVSPLQEQVRERLDAMFGADHGYADLVPGLQKVVQAAGRVLRSVDDRGWVWLLDRRYRRPEVRALLPAWWQL
ncbi:ATP-dependent DNA helicase [Roseateles sp.]|uniref:ATP-dependent DNA helicase n=1 Tax=Roseateles sp. TaxID=1971397 RepID=UPI002E0CF20C|nr:ATP-dependent DNA helicase [Roseateles sp.]